MMSTLIRDLKVVGNNFTNKQRVIVMIQSLPELTWGQMKLVLTHSENIKSFTNISRHLELEVEHIYSHRNILLVAQARKHKAFRAKRKQYEISTGAAKSLGPSDEKVAKRHRGKHTGKDKSKLKCYNCEKWDTLLISALRQRRYPLNTTLSLLMFVYIFFLLTQSLNGL